ncbi:MAG: alpha/beta fold hydrolase, partial [Deltaproteobacteria bacterium]|nr:alpha/beta fold hydrolase [Deltaproteobacteria bacterium]
MLNGVVRRRMKLAGAADPGSAGHPGSASHAEGAASSPRTEVEIALLDWGGEGPLALLHHANGFCAGMWAPIAERLRERFHVIAMDGRGHGDSSKPEDDDGYAWVRMLEDLVAVSERLLTETGQERVALGLGHSFGGTLSLGAAAARPDYFERVAMLDPVILPPPAVRNEFPGRSNELAERARRRRHHWASRDEARAYFAERAFFADWQPEARSPGPLRCRRAAGERRRWRGAQVSGSGRGRGLRRRARLRHLRCREGPRAPGASHPRDAGRLPPTRLRAAGRDPAGRGDRGSRGRASDPHGVSRPG